MNSSLFLSCGLSAVITSVVLAPSDARAGGQVSHIAMTCQDASTENDDDVVVTDVNTGDIENKGPGNVTLEYVCPVTSDSGSSSYPKTAQTIYAYGFTQAVRNSIFINDCRASATGWAAICGAGFGVNSSQAGNVTLQYNQTQGPGWPVGYPSDAYFLFLELGPLASLYSYGFVY